MSGGLAFRHDVVWWMVCVCQHTGGPGIPSDCTDTSPLCTLLSTTSKHFTSVERSAWSLVIIKCFLSCPHIHKPTSFALAFPLLHIYQSLQYFLTCTSLQHLNGQYFLQGKSISLCKKLHHFSPAFASFTSSSFSFYIHQVTSLAGIAIQKTRSRCSYISNLHPCN